MNSKIRSALYYSAFSSLMSVKAYGKCDHCGRANLLITIGVHIHEIPGTLGNEQWCLECVNAKGNEAKPQKKTRK